jgi:hypothetical protein
MLIAAAVFYFLGQMQCRRDLDSILFLGFNDSSFIRKPELAGFRESFIESKKLSTDLGMGNNSVVTAERGS